MKKFKKLLALGLSVGVLASSMICASANTLSVDELIRQSGIFYMNFGVFTRQRAKVGKIHNEWVLLKEEAARTGEPVY